MALAYPVDRRYVITTADNTKFAVLGESGNEDAGCWSVAFAPSGDWVGELLIVGRHRGKGPHDDAAGYGTVAYIREQLNGAAADYELVPDTIYGDATICVPATGLTIAVAVVCTAGSCTMYSTPLRGTPLAFRVGGT